MNGAPFCFIFYEMYRYFNYITIFSVKKCTQWDDWVNSNTPDGSGDYEPFAEVAKHSKLCTNPIKIECLTTAGFQADDLGQIITCDLCSGLQCDNMNQFDLSGCADYKVRLACLKLTPECGEFKLQPFVYIPMVSVCFIYTTLSI